ncbi:hypothetical protein M8C21_004806, partial [Ambrosia artemisiifolia]
MKNLYNAMVLFLVVISSTGLVLRTHSNNDQEISMVVDNHNPSTQHMEIIKIYYRWLFKEVEMKMIMVIAVRRNEDEDQTTYICTNANTHT